MASESLSILITIISLANILIKAKILRSKKIYLYKSTSKGEYLR